MSFLFMPLYPEYSSHLRHWIADMRHHESRSFLAPTAVRGYAAPPTGVV